VTLDAAGGLWAAWYQANEGLSQIRWVKIGDPRVPGDLMGQAGGLLPGSASPFTTSRSPLVSLGDFLSITASQGVVAIAWTGLNEVTSGGGIIYVATTILDGEAGQ
jgi:hypothetical protein